MKKTTLLFGMLLFYSVLGLAQDARNALWMGTSTGYNFYTGNYVNTPPELQTGYDNSIASICDENGQPKLLTDGNKVMISDDGVNFRLISDQLKAGYRAGAFLQNTIIIPKPSEPSRYFIVTISGDGQEGYDTGLNQGLYYSEVDVDSGEMINENIPLMTADGYLIDSSYGNHSNAITSTVHSDGVNYWLVAAIDKYGGNILMSYMVTQAGIELSPCSQHSIGFFNGSATSLKISTASGETSKIACSGQYGNAFCGLFLNDSGYILEPETGPFGHLYQSKSVEFSENGNILYLLDVYGTLYMIGFNDDAPRPAGDYYNPIDASGYYKSLQRNSNGDIYISGFMGLRKINNPNYNDYIFPSVIEDDLANLSSTTAMPQLVPYVPCSSHKTPIFTPVAPICSGVTIDPLPSTSTNGRSLRRTI